MTESKLKVMGLAEFGRKELFLAEREKSGHMACRGELGPVKLFKDLNTDGTLHASRLLCSIFSTPDHAAADIACSFFRVENGSAARKLVVHRADDDGARS